MGESERGNFLILPTSIIKMLKIGKGPKSAPVLRAVCSMNDITFFRKVREAGERTSEHLRERLLSPALLTP
jgi:hypothetical protein